MFRIAAYCYSVTLHSSIQLHFFSPAIVNQNSPFWLQYNLLTCRNKARVITPAVKLLGCSSSTATPLAGLYSSTSQCLMTFAAPVVTAASYSSPVHSNVIWQYILLHMTQFATYCFHMQLWDTHYPPLHPPLWLYVLFMTVQNKKSKSIYTACLLQGMLKNQNVNYSS